MKVIKRRFFDNSTEDVAKLLLGKLIVKGPFVGRIVETEAYLSDDPASHSFRGKTHRNAAMFSDPGTSYVYFTYGMYYCFNVVCGPKGRGEAVLIRAVEPLKGTELMKKNRKRDDLISLCNGPAKFCLAFGIDKRHNFLNLLSKKSEIFLAEDNFKVSEIKSSKRIGISAGKDLPLRFFIGGCRFVSRKN